MMPWSPAPGGTRRLEVIVLAGGTGRRLGGASKPDVVARGCRLVDHLLSGLDSLREELVVTRVVVVAPHTVVLPTGVLRTLEDPPLGGPVAGIAAGAARLAQEAASGGRAGLLGVLACDAPESWRALPLLRNALEETGTMDGACALVDGRVEYLLGVYRRPALESAVMPDGKGLRDVSVRSTLGGLDLAQVPLGALDHVAQDLDTWRDVSGWDRSRPSGT